MGLFCQLESEVLNVLRVKIPIGNTKIEVEAETEADLETALRVAKRTFEEGASAPFSSDSMSDNSEPIVQVKRPQDVEGDKPFWSNAAKRLSYSGARTNADILYIALKDFGERNNYAEPNSGEILAYVEATGGTFISKAKRPSSTARQAMRNDSRFYSTGGGFGLVEWREKDADRIAQDTF